MNNYKTNYINQVRLELRDFIADYRKARFRKDGSKCENIINSMLETIQKYKTYNENMLESVNNVYYSSNNAQDLESISCDLKASFNETISELEKMENSILRFKNNK